MTPRPGKTIGEKYDSVIATILICTLIIATILLGTLL